MGVNNAFFQMSGVAIGLGLGIGILVLAILVFTFCWWSKRGGGQSGPTTYNETEKTSEVWSAHNLSLSSKKGSKTEMKMSACEIVDDDYTYNIGEDTYVIGEELYSEEKKDYNSDEKKEKKKKSTIVEPVEEDYTYTIGDIEDEYEHKPATPTKPKPKPPLKRASTEDTYENFTKTEDKGRGQKVVLQKMETEENDYTYEI